MKKSVVASVLSLGFFCTQANAGHNVYSPIVEYGETEIELMVDVVKDDDPLVDNTKVYYLEFARGVTDRWATELLVEFVQPDGEANKAEAVEWENVYQLTEHGAGPFDYGLFFELEKAMEDGEPDEVVAGFLIQKENGDWLGLLNLMAEKEFGDNSESGAEGFGSFKLAWRKYETATPELEYYSSEYESTLGTLVSGHVKTGAKNKVGYKFGVMWGLDDNTPDYIVRSMIELELY